MKTFHLQSAYKKDQKRIEKRAYSIAQLAHVLNMLRSGHALPSIFRDHLLHGEWKGWRECHIGPDWLLIYQSTETVVMLARTGTHADLFGK